MVEQTVVPHGSDSAALLHSLLRSLLRPNGIAHLRRVERHTMVHSLRNGKNIPVRRADHTRRRRDKTIETKIQETIKFIMANKTYQCENCKLRANYEKNPKSLLGRFWRWHINFCPGWKAYFTSQDAETKQALRGKYNFQKYQ